MGNLLILRSFDHESGGFREYAPKSAQAFGHESDALEANTKDYTYPAKSDALEANQEDYTYPSKSDALEANQEDDANRSFMRSFPIPS